MKKFFVVVLVAVSILSIALPNVGNTMPCNATVLNQCYSSCRDLFSTDVMRAGCYAGCLIGCYTQGRS